MAAKVESASDPSSIRAIIAAVVESIAISSDMSESSASIDESGIRFSIISVIPASADESIVIASSGTLAMRLPKSMSSGLRTRKSNHAFLGMSTGGRKQ